MCENLMHQQDTSCPPFHLRSLARCGTSSKHSSHPSSTSLRWDVIGPEWRTGSSSTQLVQVIMLRAEYAKIADSTYSATTIRRRRDEWIAHDVFAQLE